MNIMNKEAGEMRDDVELVLSKAKDQEELRQLLDSLKSSDVISVQVSSSFLIIYVTSHSWQHLLLLPKR